MCTFLTMKWKEKACNEGFSYRVDWDWLNKPNDIPSVDRLWETEWEPQRTVDMELAGFIPIDIERTRYRMVMGALRYGRMCDGGYKTFSKDYYMKRYNGERDRLSQNLEAIYDGANILFLMYKNEYISRNKYKLALRALRKDCEWAKRNCIPYNPVDRKD